ncbi:EF-P beta-lysylation protein EpmB [Vibrio sp. SCSIO 43136]|uniref:EF-P beta-lysylation protein EpmB n=1 Tax=Vibrio sp. SCSIO 43136 TaxID=2819101 RepID=UPI002075DCB5|nr:EF-P beta-lysylation protein EpmB [Vibrio sp. SCSIO 43136]USD65087.1 EF-P beta-lysylation protein EpmB [Vibrio sp. SCSIO 43136]
MPHIITRNAPTVEQNWLQQLANAITDPNELLKQLEIDPTPWQKGLAARELFAMRVPQSFVERMEKGNPNDPLLRQVLPLIEEFDTPVGYNADPLQEQDNEQPGLLHKYKNRALLILKGGCAVNCRYCFRRHFPYQDNKGSKSVWQQSLDYIIEHTELNEVILSGGDPLMAKDSELQWLIERIEQISHIRTLRIHTRLPVVIPARITNELCQMLAGSRLNTVLVTHVNHANEICPEFRAKMAELKQTGTTLLNQGVMLKGVNDSVQAQVALSESLFDAGILPYYLHVLDKVQGAAHYFISDQEAKTIMREVMTQVSGYLVPKLTREIGGRSSKTPLDLHLE